MITLTNKQIGYTTITISIVVIILALMIKADFDHNAVFLCDAVSSDPNLDMQNCPAHNSNTPWLIIGLVIIAIILLIGSLVVLFTPLKKEKKKINFNKLSQDEIIIIKELQASEGSVYQSDLVKNTNFSKVKITRILDKLDGKDIIERQRRGMTNIIILK